MPPDQRPAALFLLTLIAGVLMVAAGLLRLGRYTRFVSHSVMIGFLTGVAVNIVAGQIPDLTGAESEGRFAIAKAFNVLIESASIDLASLAVGLRDCHLVLAGRTPWASFGAIVALAIPTIAVILLDATGVAVVSDVGEIPQGVPLPHLPELNQITFDVVLGAMSRRGDRPGPGFRRGGVGTEPGRVAFECQPGLRRAGRGQYRVVRCSAGNRSVGPSARPR